MKSATSGTGPFENAVDVTHAPSSSNQATASGRCPPSVTAARAFSENAAIWGAVSSCARSSSASVVVRSRTALSPSVVIAFP